LVPPQGQDTGLSTTRPLSECFNLYLWLACCSRAHSSTHSESGGSRVKSCSTHFSVHSSCCAFYIKALCCSSALARLSLQISDPLLCTRGIRGVTQ